MPCHGDRGQGLTDEFRGLWEEDHQDCWARGCHGGRVEDEGFPVPRIVPALVGESQMERFPSQQALSDYLQSTHPPQSPGILKGEEYRAIALFVFTMNGRQAEPAVTESAFPVPTITPTAPQNSAPVRDWKYAAAIPVAVLAFFLLVFRLARKSH
jgi:hypothetical protein